MSRRLANETPEQRARRLERQDGYNKKRRGPNRGRSRQSPEVHKAKRAAYMRQWRFGLSPEQWDQLFESQGRKCICGKTEPDRGKGWTIDHDHKSGQVRGILCNGCNIALGLLNDDRELLLGLAAYLDRKPVVIAFAKSGTLSKERKTTKKMKRLSCEQVDLLLMRREQGCTIKAIAAELGITPAAVCYQCAKHSLTIPRRSEPRWRDGGKHAAGPDDRLVPWERDAA